MNWAVTEDPAGKSITTQDSTAKLWAYLVINMDDQDVLEATAFVQYQGSMWQPCPQNWIVA